MQFQTKAETLKLLYGKLKKSNVLPLLEFTVSAWKAGADAIFQGLLEQPWGNGRLIVRSSAVNEDSALESMAGKYTSIADVQGEQAFFAAVEEVIASFGEADDNDQVFVQPMLERVEACGVLFTMDPNTGGNYYIINYDDETGSTSSVTSGSGESLKTFYYFKGYQKSCGDGMLDSLLQAAAEIEAFFENNALDIEFAVTGAGQPVILQVRPLVMKQEPKKLDKQMELLGRVYHYIEKNQGSKPYVFGKKAVYGVMPDWNPAEIVGIRPKPLALSLYKNLITDGTWAYQRDTYGYKDLRSFPLIIDFAGLPYIDVRVSFNSFVPKSADSALAEKLVEYYLERLIQNPSMHDKVEFEIIFSCYTFDLPERIRILKQYGFTAEECEEIERHLNRLTNRIVNTEKGLWMVDAKKISILEERQQEIKKSDLDPVSKVYWLLEDCRRYGTLPFAGLARAGFIAVQILKSLVTTGVFTEKEYTEYMSSLETVSTNMTYDLANLSRKAFLKKYGHLRPGTYDICSPRYDEEPERYFDTNSTSQVILREPGFRMSIAQMETIRKMLGQAGLSDDILSLFQFLKGAIEGREYSKFVFSKSLSDALVILGELGEQYGISRDELSYLDIEALKAIYNSERDIKQELLRSIRIGKERYEQTLGLTMPPVISRPQDCMYFHLGESVPNFITLGKACGNVRQAGRDKDLEGSILFIPSADPGYDWIFSRKIAGFVTKYGGANSHMAIRSGELAIPAVIGAGEKLYQRLSSAQVVEIDCALKKAVIIK